MQDNDIRVNDESKHMAPSPTDDEITVGGTQEKEALQIPLSFKGVVSYFPTRKPTGQEWEASEFSRQIELSAETPEWDPSTSLFKEQEASMFDSNG